MNRIVTSSEPEYWTNYHGTHVTVTSPYEIIDGKLYFVGSFKNNTNPKHKPRKCFKSKEQIKVGG